MADKGERRRKKDKIERGFFMIAWEIANEDVGGAAVAACCKAYGGNKPANNASKQTRPRHCFPKLECEEIK